MAMTDSFMVQPSVLFLTCIHLFQEQLINYIGLHPFCTGFTSLLIVINWDHVVSLKDGAGYSLDTRAKHHLLFKSGIHTDPQMKTWKCIVANKHCS